MVIGLFAEIGRYSVPLQLKGIGSGLMQDVSQIKKKGQLVEVPVDDVEFEFSLRDKLNEDRVQSFEDSYRTGQEVPPPEITPDRKGLDGRHRFEALKRLGRKSVECLVVDIPTEPERRAYAFKRNEGGSLPPTRSEKVRVIRELIEGGCSSNDLIDLFKDVYTVALIREYTRAARQLIKEARLRLAVAEVAKGEKTAKTVAEEFRVDLETLTAEIAGHKKRKRSHSDERRVFVAGIEKTYRSVAHRAGKTFSLVAEEVRGGETTLENALAMIEAEEKCADARLRNLKDWRSRFHQAAGQEAP